MSKIPNCKFCRKPINPRPGEHFRFITGWERKRTQGGQNAVALRTEQNEYACLVCIDMLKNSMDPGQGSLI